MSTAIWAALWRTSGPASFGWKGGIGEAFEEGLHAGRYGGAFCPVASAEDMFKGLAACDLGSGGGVILFKGSRSNKLETLVNAFTEAQAGDPHAV